MVEAIVASIIGSLLGLVALFFFRRLIGSLLGAGLRLVLRYFLPEQLVLGTAARSPRVSEPPNPPFEYVARPDDEDEVARLLLADKPVCITGGPGIGKSCVAMAVVQRPDIKARFSDGIWWLNAAGMDLSAMCETVGSALNAPEVARAKSDDEKLDTLRTAIAGKNVIVVLDNCENPAASHRLAEAHRATLVTSQHRPTGPEPVTLDRLTDDQCLEILRHKADRSLSSEEELIVAEIVKLLHGHPFAAALTGSQLHDAAAQQVLKDLKSAPWPVLTDKGRKERAMKRSLDGAYKRLPGDDRRLFAALGVFGGPTFDLAAVRAVEACADAVLMDALVYRSLVRKEDARYALHPLVRRYAHDRLGRKRQPYEKMADHYLARAALLGHDPSTFAQLEPDVANALAAMDWCLEARRWKNAASFAVALSGYLELRGLWGERRRRLEQGRWAAKRAREPWLRGACSNSLGIAAQQQGDYEEARRLYEESLAIAEELGHRLGMAATKRQLGMLAQDQGDYDEARRLYEESLAIERKLDNRLGISQSQGQLGILAQLRGEHEEAHRLYEESLAIAEELGDHPGIAMAKHQLGILAQHEGDRDAARRLYDESLAIKEELGDRRGIAATKHQLGMLAQNQGEYEEARRLYGESLAIEEELGNRLGIAQSKHQLGNLAEEEGDRAAAHRLYQEALAIFESLGSPEAERARQAVDRVSSAERKKEQ